MISHFFFTIKVSLSKSRDVGMRNIGKQIPGFAKKSISGPAPGTPEIDAL